MASATVLIAVAISIIAVMTSLIAGAVMFRRG